MSDKKNELLKNALQKENDKNMKTLPSSVTDQMLEATKTLKQEGYENKPFNVGDKIPDGMLINHLGKDVAMSKLLKGKPAIITFYRGAWCPYCNLQLIFYDKLLNEMKDHNINMFAISPEKPDVTTESIDIEKLNFTVLSDKDNKFAKQLNLVFKFTNSLNNLYKNDLDIDLEKSQGNKNAELPIPATYVIDANGVIKNAWIDADYTKRAEPSEVIEAYKKII